MKSTKSLGKGVNNRMMGTARGLGPGSRNPGKSRIRMGVQQRRWNKRRMSLCEAFRSCAVRTIPLQSLTNGGLKRGGDTSSVMRVTVSTEMHPKFCSMNAARAASEVPVSFHSLISLRGGSTMRGRPEIPVSTTVDARFYIICVRGRNILNIQILTREIGV